MTLDEYQEKAMSTCMPSSNNWEYMFTGLVGEVGELASKVAKAVRKSNLRVMDNELCSVDSEAVGDEILDGIIGEIGDCAWFLAGICSTFNLSLEDVCNHNIDKLASRKQRGVIDGNGDNR